MPFPHSEYPMSGAFSTIKFLAMKKLFNRIDRIRASGFATLNLEQSSPYYHLNGQRFKECSMGKPGLKCRVTLLVDNMPLDFTIDDIL